jgi:hypothetical protein
MLMSTPCRWWCCGVCVVGPPPASRLACGLPAPLPAAAPACLAHRQLTHMPFNLGKGSMDFGKGLSLGKGKGAAPAAPVVAPVVAAAPQVMRVLVPLPCSLAAWRMTACMHQSCRFTHACTTAHTRDTHSQRPQRTPAGCPAHPTDHHDASAAAIHVRCCSTACAARAYAAARGRVCTPASSGQPGAAARVPLRAGECERVCVLPWLVGGLQLRPGWWRLSVVRPVPCTPTHGIASSAAAAAARRRRPCARRSRRCT